MDNPPFCMRRGYCLTGAKIKWGVRRSSPRRAGLRPYIVAAHNKPPRHIIRREGVAGAYHGDLFVTRALNAERVIYPVKKGVSWRKIKAEYVAGGISQRALAEKYGVPMTTLVKHAKKEKWTTRRKQAEDKAVEKASEKVAEAAADNAATLERIKSKLLARLETMVDEYPGKNAAELKVRTARTESKYSIRDIAAVYAALEDKTAARGQSADIEDLAPLADLLKD